MYNTHHMANDYTADSVDPYDHFGDTLHISQAHEYPRLLFMWFSTENEYLRLLANTEKKPCSLRIKILN